LSWDRKYEVKNDGNGAREKYINQMGNQSSPGRSKAHLILHSIAFRMPIFAIYLIFSDKIFSSGRTD
jgi:hypothetical protein